jgi:hypothetical protein
MTKNKSSLFMHCILAALLVGTALMSTSCGPKDEEVPIKTGTDTLPPAPGQGDAPGQIDPGTGKATPGSGLPMPGTKGGK